MKQGVPKHKRSKCEIYDEEVILLFDNITKRVTVKHDPKMIIPVLTVNPGINNYQLFSNPFVLQHKKNHIFNACLKTTLEIQLMKIHMTEFF